MAKKTCPPRGDQFDNNVLEGQLDHANETFQKLWDQYSGDNPLGTAIQIHNMLYDSDVETAHLFYTWLERGKAYHGRDTGYLAGAIESQDQYNIKVSQDIKGFDSNEFTDDLKQTIADNMEESGDTKEGTEGVDEEDRNVSGNVHVGDTGLDFIDTLVYDALGITISKDKNSNIVSKTRDAVTFEEFKANLAPLIIQEAISQNIMLDGNPIKDMESLKELFAKPSIESALRKQFISNLSKNRNKRDESKEFYYHNAEIVVETDEKGEEYLVVKVEKGQHNIFKLHDKHGEDTDLKTGTKLPDYVAGDFVSNDETSTIGGHTVGTLTYKLPLNSILRGHHNSKTKSNWWTPANLKMSPDVIERLKTQLLQNTVNGKKSPITVVAIKPGDSGTFYLTPVVKSHFDLINAKDIISEYIKDGTLEKSGLSKDVIKLIETYNYNLSPVITTITDAMGSPTAKGTKSVMKDLNNILDALIRLRDHTYKKGFERYVDIILMERLEAYTSESDNAMKEMIKEDLNDYINDKPAQIDTYVWLASKVAEIEYMSSVRGLDFLMRGNMLANMNRLRLDFSKGLVMEGQDDFKYIAIDPLSDGDVTFEVDGKDITDKVITTVEGIKGVKYIGDGAIWSSSKTLDDTANTLGDKEFKDVKTVWRYINPSGQVDYISVKGQEMVAIPGLTIKKDGKIVARFVKEDGKMMIKDRYGNDVDYLITADENKMPAGKFSKEGGGYYRTQTLSQDSRRIIITPKDKSAPSSAFPMQFVDLLEDPRFGAIRDIINEHLIDVADSYSNSIIDMAENPNALRKAMKYIYRLRGDSPNALQRSMDMSEHAPHHPSRLPSFLQLIYNKFIIKGIFQGRTKGPNKNGYGGSGFKMKPDIIGWTKDDNSVVVSSGNTTTFNNVVKHYIKGKDMTVKQFHETFKSKEDKIKALNEFLSNSEVYMLMHRNPVDSAYSVSLKRIQEFTLDDHGDTIFASPKTVFGQWRGDHDGDNAYGEILPENITNKLKDIGLHKSIVFEDTPVDLGGWFRHDSHNLRYTNEQHKNQAMSEIAMTQGTTGRVTNLRTVRGTLLMKGVKVTLKNGDVYTIRDPQERVVMDYAPINENITEEDLANSPANIVEIDGQRYLETTSEHELTILLNATTDNAKEALLGQWGFNEPGFLQSRIWKNQDGEFTKDEKEIKKIGLTLRAVESKYKHGNRRKGRGDNRLRHTLDTALEDLHKLSEFLNLSKEEQGEHLAKSINLLAAQPTRKTKPAMVENVEVNGYKTSLEKVITRLIDRIHTKFGDDIYNPYIRSKEKYWNTHYEAMTRLEDVFNLNFALNDVEAQIVYDFVYTKQYGQKFFNLMIERKRDNNKSRTGVNMSRLDFNEDQAALTKQGLIDIQRMIDERSPGSDINDIKAGITMLYLRGIGRVKNVGVLPDVLWFEKTIYNEFMKLWESFDSNNTVPSDRELVTKESYNPSTTVVSKNLKKEC